MKKQLIFFIFLINSLSFANAKLNLSPGRIDFIMPQGEKQCQTVTLTSEDYSSTIRLRDSWTNNIMETNIHKYNVTAGEFGLIITYPAEIRNFDGEEEIEICITGEKMLNKTRGNLIFTPYSNTNVVVEVGTWLFVTITKPLPKPTQNTETKPTTTTQQAASSGGGGGGGTYTPTTNEIEETPEQNQPTAVVVEETNPESEEQQATEEKQETDASKITGAAVAQNPIKTATIWGGIIIIIVLAITIAAFIFKQKKQI
jgi:hypothetical protein